MWIDVATTPQVMSAITIRALRTMFATHCPQEVIVTDNITVFTSAEFQDFFKKNEWCTTNENKSVLCSQQYREMSRHLQTWLTKSF